MQSDPIVILDVTRHLVVMLIFTTTFLVTLFFKSLGHVYSVKILNYYSIEEEKNSTTQGTTDNILMYFFFFFFLCTVWVMSQLST